MKKMKYVGKMVNKTFRDMMNRWATNVGMILPDREVIKYPEKIYNKVEKQYRTALKELSMDGIDCNATTHWCSEYKDADSIESALKDLWELKKYEVVKCRYMGGILAVFKKNSYQSITDCVDNPDFSHFESGKYVPNFRLNLEDIATEVDDGYTVYACFREEN
jgi:hypothetical protein